MQSIKRAIAIIYSICSELLDFLESSDKNGKLPKQYQWKSSLQAVIYFILFYYAISIYFMYGHPKKIKFNQKYQQYGPCFQSISPFLMAIV